MVGGGCRADNTYDFRLTSMVLSREPTLFLRPCFPAPRRGESKQRVEDINRERERHSEQSKEADFTESHLCPKGPGGRS